MNKILQLNTSLSGRSALSSTLAARAAAQIYRAAATGTAVEVTVRDLAAEPLPHLSAERFAAFTTPAAQRTADQVDLVAESDALIAELQAADVIVLAMPMYNFGIPSTLKAYFDHIARAGVTFKYTEQGPVGLLTGKRLVVIATRGGRYAGTPADSQSAYVRQFFGFLGIEDVEFVYVEGLALGDASRAAAIHEGAERIEALTSARDACERIEALAA